MKTIASARIQWYADRLKSMFLSASDLETLCTEGRAASFIADVGHTELLAPCRSLPHGNVVVVKYKKRYLFPFNLTTEYIGEEGKGDYGIALFESISYRAEPRSLVLSEDGEFPRIRGRNIAMERVRAIAQEQDQTEAVANKIELNKHRFVEEGVFNTITGSLLRAEPGFLSFEARDGISLPPEFFEEVSIRIPDEGFLSRDHAAEALLCGIARVLGPHFSVDRQLSQAPA